MSIHNSEPGENSTSKKLRSKAREFHPQLLTVSDLSLSTHPAHVSTLNIHSSEQKAVPTFGSLSEAIYRTLLDNA